MAKILAHSGRPLLPAAAVQGASSVLWLLFVKNQLQRNLPQSMLVSGFLDYEMLAALSIQLR